MSVKSATKTNPSKWKRIVAEVKAGSKGGDPGEWSARKAQLATQKYKATNRAKAAGNKAGKQFVAQPKTIAKKVAKFRK